MQYYVCNQGHRRRYPQFTLREQQANNSAFFCVTIHCKQAEPELENRKPAF